MRSRRVGWIFAFSTVLACATVGAGQEEKLKELRGTLRQIDLKTGAAALQLLNSDKHTPLGLATKDVPVTNFVGQKLSLTALRPDLRVTVKLRGEEEIAAIRVDGPCVHGTVKKSDAAARTIVFKDVYAVKTIRVPGDIKLMAQGQETALDRLKSGDPIQVFYSLDRKSILQLQTGKGTHIRDPYLRIQRYFGILADVDHARRTVQVFMQSIDAGLVKSYEVAPDAYLQTTYHFKPIREIGFDQIAKWVKVFYYVDRDTGRIVNIDAEAPLMNRRKVVKIDADKITLEDEQKEKTLPLAAEVKVFTPRGDGKLADVAANRIVTCGLTLDRSGVQMMYLWDR